ncbi:MAG: ATP-dependent DNA helicase [Thermoplasmata archaeon]
MMNDIFPYTPRLGQNEIIEDIKTCLNSKMHFVFEAPTGTGKTIVILAPVLEFALKNHKKVVYVTRTNSQQIQVLKEARALRKYLDFRAFPLQGRNNYCMLATEGELKEGGAEELSLICENLKKKVLKNSAKACEYYYNFMKDNGKKLIDFQNSTLATAEEVVEHAKFLRVCPYETMKIALRNSDLVVASYPYFFDPFIRAKILEWMQCDIKDIILIVDEAHNVPDFAREERSLALSIKILQRFDSEIVEYGEFNYKNIKSSEFSEIVKEAMNRLGSDLLAGNEEATIIGSEFEELLMDLSKKNSVVIREYLKELKKFGEKIRLKKLDSDKLPRSYIYSTASFLLDWFDEDSDDMIKLISGDDDLKLEIYSLDPTPITSAVENTYVSIHMSGTLKPLDEYTANIFTELVPIKKVYPSPFSSENLKIKYIEDITTKYDVIEKDNTELKKIRRYIKEILSASKRNSVVFFPSYRVLDKMLKIGLDIPGNLYLDTKELKQKDFVRLVNLFKKKGGTFVTVIGSRFSEGLDFPEGELELVIIVGIPYPKPTVKQKALEEYYTKKFGKEFGYLYTVKAPATRKMLQAIGRMIRSETDRGFAVILDRRITYFKEYIDASKSENIKKEIEEFFKNREKNL